MTGERKNMLFSRRGRSLYSSCHKTKTSVQTIIISIVVTLMWHCSSSWSLKFIICMYF